LSAEKINPDLQQEEKEFEGRESPKNVLSKRVEITEEAKGKLLVLSKYHARIFETYKKVTDEILKDAKKRFPKISQQTFLTELHRLVRETIQGDPKSLSNEKTFSERCNQLRMELAKEFYREVRGDYQNFSAVEFLERRKELGMDGVLFEMGLVKGEYSENLNFFREPLPKMRGTEVKEKECGELIWESAQIFAKKYGVSGKALYRMAISVFCQESHGDYFAVSRGYALGIAGLTSCQFLGEDAKFPAINPLNPHQAISREIDFFASLLKKNLGNIDLTLSSYNAGSRAVQIARKKGGKNYKKFLTKEAQEYAAKTRDYYKEVEADLYLAKLLVKTIKLQKTVWMRKVVIVSNRRQIPDFKIPKNRQIITTGKRKGDLIQAKFHSNYFKEYLIGWVPIEVLRT